MQLTSEQKQIVKKISLTNLNHQYFQFKKPIIRKKESSSWITMPFLKQLGRKRGEALC